MIKSNIKEYDSLIKEYDSLIDECNSLEKQSEKVMILLILVPFIVLIGILLILH